MEIKEILSYYFDQDTKRMDVSFRLTIDSEDEIRNDILKLEEDFKDSCSVLTLEEISTLKRVVTDLKSKLNKQD